jgi:hypothetical protein
MTVDGSQVLLVNPCTPLTIVNARTARPVPHGKPTPASQWRHHCSFTPSLPSHRAPNYDQRSR